MRAGKLLSLKTGSRMGGCLRSVRLPQCPQLSLRERVAQAWFHTSSFRRGDGAAMAMGYMLSSAVPSVPSAQRQGQGWGLGAQYAFKAVCAAEQ